MPVGYLLRSQLELAAVEWPESLDSLRPRRPQPKKPFPYVREAIKATVKGFDKTERGQLIMACGTGKTLVGLWSSERLGSARTLVLVPSLSLLAQTLREWTANATEPFEYLAVCSDETVVGEDEFVASTAELGVPVTTDRGNLELPAPPWPAGRFLDLPVVATSRSGPARTHSALRSCDCRRGPSLRGQGGG